MAQSRQRQGQKGNPASHRMSNPHRKDRCTKAHLRRTKRAERLRNENAERAAENRKLRKEGLPTAWEIQRAKRKESRKPKQEEYQRRLAMLGSIPVKQRKSAV